MPVYGFLGPSWELHVLTRILRHCFQFTINSSVFQHYTKNTQNFNILRFAAGQAARERFQKRAAFIGRERRDGLFGLLTISSPSS